MRIAITFLFAAAMLGAQSPAARQQPQLPADCAADGTVVNALTGQPLPRATITPSANDGGTGTSTDAEGKWAISSLTCGPRIFRAEKDGYIQNSYGRSASAPATGSPKSVPLTPGSAVHNLKIELMPESFVIGRVLDDAGDPVANAQVRAERSVVQNGKRTTQGLGGTNTDSTGAFRLGELQAGRYFFCASSRSLRYPVGGGSASVYADSCFPGPVTSGSGSALRVEGGQEVRANFTLTQVTGVHVRGTITGFPPQVKPDRDATVRVQMYRLEADGRIDAGRIRPQQSRNGKFDFPNVTPGSYALRANYGGSNVVTAGASVDVGSTDLEGVSLVFQAAAPVSGTVHIEDVAQSTSQQTGQSTDQQSLGVAGSTAGPTASPTADVFQNAVGFGSPTGRIQWDSEQKSFVIPDVQPGKYRIQVNPRGPGYFVKSIRLNDRNLRNQDFMVEGAAGPIEIVISNDSGFLKGSVNDTDGNPTASWILVRCGDYPIQAGRSKDDGTFSIGNIPAGPCKAWSFDELSEVEYADEDWMRRYAGTGTDVNISSGSTAQVSLVRRAVPQ